MNENDVLAALGGVGRTNDEGEVDYKARCDELTKMIQSERVEAGRLKKANEENARLKAENEELRSKQRTESALSALSEQQIRDIPNDFLDGASKIAQATVDSSLQNQNERIAVLENEIRANREASKAHKQKVFLERVNSAFPGFLNSIQPGGDKCEPWKKYQRFNAGTIANAIETGDYDTLSYHIRNFYNTFLGVSLPSATDEATPEPRNYAGGGGSQILNTDSSREYTVQEYQSIINDAQTKFHAHKITYQQYAKICDDLEIAFKEGRVK